MKHILANVIIIIAIAALPWWVSVVLLILLNALFDFPEILVYGVVMDVLYAVPERFLGTHTFFFSAVVAYTLMCMVRPNLRAV